MPRKTVMITADDHKNGTVLLHLIYYLKSFLHVLFFSANPRSSSLSQLPSGLSSLYPTKSLQNQGYGKQLTNECFNSVLYVFASAYQLSQITKQPYVTILIIQMFGIIFSSSKPLAQIWHLQRITVYSQSYSF